MKLRLKYLWYKYVRHIDIVGFFYGIPVIRTKYLQPIEKGENHERRYKEKGDGNG